MTTRPNPGAAVSERAPLSWPEVAAHGKLERSDRTGEAEGTSGGWPTGEQGDSEPEGLSIVQ